MTINSVYGLRATCIHNKVPYPIGKCSNKCVSVMLMCLCGIRNGNGQ